MVDALAARAYESSIGLVYNGVALRKDLKAAFLKAPWPQVTFTFNRFMPSWAFTKLCSRGKSGWEIKLRL